MEQLGKNLNTVSILDGTEELLSDLLLVIMLLWLCKKCLFFRDAVGNIWEWNVMMSGMAFRILLPKKKKMKQKCQQSR